MNLFVNAKVTAGRILMRDGLVFELWSRKDCVVFMNVNLFQAKIGEIVWNYVLKWRHDRNKCNEYRMLHFKLWKESFQVTYVLHADVPSYYSVITYHRFHSDVSYQ